MRVLQVTDCHVLGDPSARVYGVDTYRSLRRVLRAALSLPDPPDLVVATGDLAEDGSDASYRRLREVFLHTRLPVYVVAGNHDSLPAMHRSLIGGAIRMQACLDLAAWRVVFLDSTVAGEPYGCLDEIELRRLEENLRERTAVPTIVCVHHGPIRPCPASGCHLRNDAELLATLGAYSNARVVIAGHAHLEATRWAGHTELLTTPATSLQCAHAQQGELVDHEDFRSSHRFDTSRHGFRMLTLYPDGGFESAVHWLANDTAPTRACPNTRIRMTSDIAPVDRSNCEHYVWGAGCDGWRLLASAALSVIQERVPPGASEVMHFHSEAQQFFFVLSGHATLELEDRSVELGVGQGLRVPPRVPHRFGNRSGRDVVFLVISSPTSAGDRTDLTDGGSGCTRDSAST